MGLKTYAPRTETVKVNGADGEHEFVVRGLHAEAIRALVQSQGDTMRELYQRALAGEFTATDTAALLETMLDEAPLLVGLVIAFGCDEPEEWERVLQIPFADQVVLVDTILRLTFDREGGAKKVMEIIARAVSDVKLSRPTEAAPRET